MPRIGTVLFIALLLLTVNAGAIPAKERVRQLLESSDYELLSAELTRASVSGSSEFIKNNYDYLLARIDEKRGDYASAAQKYHSVALRDPDLRPYALKHLSQIMRSSGTLAFERLFLDEIVYGETDGTLSGSARLRLVRNYFESGEYASVIDSIKNGLGAPSHQLSEGSGRELQLLLGNAYLREKKFREALDVFDELIVSVPNPDQPDDFALEAAKGLDRINNGDSKLGVEVAGLAADEHKRRADIYQFNRNFLLARLHYKAIAENHKGDIGIPGAMNQIAWGFDQERSYPESLSWYRKILIQYPKSGMAPAALYGEAGAYANLNDTKNAVAAYRKYIEENPDARNLERAYLNIVDAYRDAGDNNKALEWSSKAQNVFSGETGEALALFSDARIHISSGEWNRAIPALKRLRGMKKLGGTRIAGGTNNEEAAFLTAFVLEKLGRTPEAIDIYLETRKGRTDYYGWRATEKLRALSTSPKYKEAIDSRIKESEKVQSKLPARPGANKVSRRRQSDSGNEAKSIYKGPLDDSQIRDFDFDKQTPLSKVAVKLFDLGLYDEAVPEIELSLRRGLELNGDELSDFDEDTSYALAVLYSKAGFADRAIRFIEPKWKKIRSDLPIERLPKAQALLLYPAPFRDELLKYGKKENVDPRFLLAIMRQESRFQTDVKSAAAARGLMQFISGTSRKIAAELEIERFSSDDLFDPDTAIRFGSRYLGNLFKEFPGRPEAVAASYNGGEDRMARWLKRSKTDDPDRYVSEIIFSQTKDYVYQVMANYRIYDFLYDRDLMPRTRKSGG